MSIISKKKMNELLNLSNDPKIELVEETKKSYKIKITGDKDKVKKSSFENKVLEFMSDMTQFVKEQKEFNNSVVDFMKEQKEFNKEQKEFNNSVVDFIEEQKEFNKKQKEFNNSVVDFIKEQKEFNKEQKEFNKEQKEFNKEQKEFNQKVDQRLSVLESFHKDDFRKNTNHKR